MRRAPRARRQLGHLQLVEDDQRASYPPLPPAGQVSQAATAAAIAGAAEPLATAAEPPAAVAQSATAQAEPATADLAGAQAPV